MPDVQRIRGGFWLPNLLKKNKEIAKVDSVTRASQFQTSGETLKMVPSATWLLVIIIVFINPPGHLLKCLNCCSADYTYSSQVIKYVLEEPDKVLTHGMARKQASPLSKYKQTENLKIAPNLAASLS